jgi:hypothetical protein
VGRQRQSGLVRHFSEHLNAAILVPQDLKNHFTPNEEVIVFVLLLRFHYRGLCHRCDINRE